MNPHVPALAPPVHRKNAAHQEQEHLLLLGTASDKNHGLGSGHSTRSEPQMGRANEQQRATPWLSTLQHSADLTLETSIIDAEPTHASVSQEFVYSFNTCHTVS